MNWLIRTISIGLISLVPILSGCIRTFPLVPVTMVPSTSDKLAEAAFKPATKDFRPTALTIAVSDEPIIYIGKEDGSVQSVALSLQRTIRTFPVDIDDPADLLAVSSDGRILCSAASRWDDRRNYVHIWDARTGALLTNIQVSTGPITALAVSPDGQYVAYQAGGTSPGFVHLWDRRQNAEIWRSEVHYDSPLFFRQMPNSEEWLCAEGALWSIKAGAPPKRIASLSRGPQALNPDWSRAYHEGAGQVQVSIWHGEELLQSGGILEGTFPGLFPLRVLLQERFRKIPMSYSDLQVSPNGRYLLIVALNEAYLLDLSSASETLVCAQPLGVLIDSARISPDGKFVAACGQWGVKVFRMPG